MNRIVQDFNSRSLLAGTGGEVRVAAVSYNREAKVEFGFRSTEAEISAGINNISLNAAHGGTFIYKGLNKARTTVLDPANSLGFRNYEVPVILVMISDGQTLVPEGRSNVLAQAISEFEQLNNDTVIRTVFQIGSKPNTDVLNLLASEREPLRECARALGSTVDSGSATQDKVKLLYSLECSNRTGSLPLDLSQQIWDEIRCYCALQLLQDDLWH